MPAPTRAMGRVASRIARLLTSLSLVGLTSLTPSATSAAGETIEVTSAHTYVTYTEIGAAFVGDPSTTYQVRLGTAATCGNAGSPSAGGAAELVTTESDGSGVHGAVIDPPIPPGDFVVAALLTEDGTTTLATSACFEVTGTLTPPPPGVYEPVLTDVYVFEPARQTIVLDYSRSEADVVCDSALDDAFVPDPADFDVTLDGAAVPVAEVDLSSGDGCPFTARLQLAAPLSTGVIEVTYSPGATQLRTRHGDLVEGFSWGSGEVLERASATLGAGASTGTDGEGDGAGFTDPIETIVTAPADGGGTVTIVERHTGGLAGGHPTRHMLSLQSFIQTDIGTTASPLQIEFILDAGRLVDNFGTTFPASELEVLAHGALLQACDAGAGTTATPEPCEVSRSTQADGVHIVARSSASARIWTFGYDLAPLMVPVQSTRLTSYDHVIFLLTEEIDATSLPAASDFTVTVDGVPQPTTGVTLLVSGLAGLSQSIGLFEGLTFLKVDWANPVSGFGTIDVTYTPGTDPIRDLGGNLVGAISAPVEFLNIDLTIGVMEDATGPEHLLLFVPGPLATLPDPGDFAVSVDGEIQVPTDVVRRFPDVGVTLLDLTLPMPVMPSAGVSISYLGAPLTYTDGGEAPAMVDVYVDTSGLGIVSGGTWPPEEGGSVTVAPRDASTLASNTRITFPEVITGGVTTVASAIETSAPLPIPANFSVGDPAAYFEISTTATFVAPAEVCIAYDPSAYADESLVRLLHFEAGAWEDVTTSLNQAGNMVCGNVDSFSPFAVVEVATGGFTFEGFFAPVDNAQTINRTNAGRAVPFTFSLGGDMGLDVLAAGSPSSVRVACPAAQQLDTIETSASAGAAALSYDSATGTYTFVWKTLKSWAGTCREFTMTFTDGTEAQAMFQFTK